VKQVNLPAIAGGTPVRTTPLPYGRHHIDEADVQAVIAALRSGTLTGGTAIAKFEAALADRCGVAHAVACANGTAALHLALMGVGVSSGDQVITTPLTFAATANAVLFCDAEPIFADIGLDRCLDPEAAGSMVNDRTRAVIAVDYSGVPADAPALRNSLPSAIPLIVDAAHSLGATLGDRPAGSLGDVTTLSFHPVKLITSGEGGACLTDNPDIASRMRRLRNHGMTSSAAERVGAHWRYDVTDLGHNYRLTDIQAALGASQLRRLDAAVARRRRLAARYDEALADVEGVVLPSRPAGRESAWHLYAVEVDAAAFGMPRDAVVDGLRAEGIEATVHYPAVHLLRLYRDRGHREGELPAAEAACARLVTLPLFPDMSDGDQDDVVEALQRLHAWSRHAVAGGA
jgi:dTDP-4-amino-4,6-dideoxygalactose transaminase